MQKVEDIAIGDYNYPLPDERIAKYPLPRRDRSKLLVYRKGEISEKRFFNLPDEIAPGSLMIFNNTKVIQARLHFRKETGALIEIFCLEPSRPADYLLSFQSDETCEWVCLVGNLKKWKEGSLERRLEIDGERVTLSAERIAAQENNAQVIRFCWDNRRIAFATLLEAIGELPIPPYLNRETEASDKETYQTVYSKIEGSVAAPTAGLHFTPEVLAALRKKKIETGELTLHVGAGTFKPVKCDKIGKHEMHTEFISVERTLIERLIAAQGAIIAVGTTSVRTLESLYYMGAKLKQHPAASAHELIVGQWEPYTAHPVLTRQEALQQIVDYLDRTGQSRLVSATRIMIAPGYTFRVVRGIVTNFHQPQSTLLLLVSAFVDGRWREIYDYALNHDFRFLSYGDSSLLLPLSEPTVPDQR